MTQFVVVTGDVDHLEPPPEVSVLPMLDESDLQAIGWCDVYLLGISWLSDGRDLALHLQFAQGVERRLQCLWASGVRLDLKYPEGCGGRALTWDAAFKRNGLGWEVTLDFASLGAIELTCANLKFGDDT
jgi:hypothetical protein